MKIEEKDFVWIAIAAVVLLIASMWFNVRYVFSGQSDSEYRDSVWVTVYDTVAIYKPAPNEEKPLGSITAKLPLSVSKLPKNVLKFPECTQNLQDSVQNFGKSSSEDSVTVLSYTANIGNDCDSADVIVPITQKKYGDSTYTAYVSGYNASLDSIYTYSQTKIVTIKEKPKRWHLSVSAGYGITPKGFQPCLMVGVSYTIFTF